jgi:predicted component of type VI protein secretion system
MDFQLVVIRGRSAAQAIRLSDGITTIGRHSDCQLRVNSSQVSRKHCQIFEKKGLLLVKDLGSSNGTYVNGEKIDEQRVLEPGDELGVGQVKFRVEKLSADAARPAAKPHDTGVPAAAPTAEVDEGLGELSFDDDEPIFDNDDAFEIQIDEPADSPPEPAAPAAVVDEATAPPKPVAPAKKPQPAEEAAALPDFGSKDEPAELGEEAVADFLLNIELDEEDKH